MFSKQKIQSCLYLFLVICFVHWTMLLYWSTNCPSRDRNKCEAMNGSVSLAVSISRENLARRLPSVLLVVLVLVACKFLWHRTEAIWCLITHITWKQGQTRFQHWHCIIIGKITRRHMLHRLLRNFIMENHIKLAWNNYWIRAQS